MLPRRYPATRSRSLACRRGSSRRARLWRRRHARRSRTWTRRRTRHRRRSCAQQQGRAAFAARARGIPPASPPGLNPTGNSGFEQGFNVAIFSPRKGGIWTPSIEKCYRLVGFVSLGLVASAFPLGERFATREARMFGSKRWWPDISEDMPVDILPCSNGEFAPRDPTQKELAAMQLASETAEVWRRKVGMSRRQFV